MDLNKKIFKEVLIELATSKIHGIGVFAARKIKKRQFIAEGIHKEDYKDLVSWEEVKYANKDIKKKILDFCIGSPKGFVSPEDNDFNKLCIEWYFNHSCNGNVGFNKNGDFIAIRNIRKGEELTYDYGLAESNPKFKMKCNCSNSNCRKIITGNDWKNLEFRKNNLMSMLPALRGKYEGNEGQGPIK
jgi:SET domain-containing protein